VWRLETDIHRIREGTSSGNVIKRLYLGVFDKVLYVFCQNSAVGLIVPDADKYIDNLERGWLVRRNQK
jgi:hypothetical protein